MRLISELIYKNTCIGIKLSKNIVFIADYNPYRVSKNIKIPKIRLSPNQIFNKMKNLNDKEKNYIQKYLLKNNRK